MPQIILDFTEEEFLVLQTIAHDPEEWINFFLKNNRIPAKRKKLLKDVAPYNPELERENHVLNEATILQARQERKILTMAEMAVILDAEMAAKDAKRMEDLSL